MEQYIYQLVKKFDWITLCWMVLLILTRMSITFLNFSWARIWQCLYICLPGAWRLDKTRLNFEAVRGLQKWWALAEILHTCSWGHFSFFFFPKFWFWACEQVLKRWRGKSESNFRQIDNLAKKKGEKVSRMPQRKFCYLILNI